MNGKSVVKLASDFAAGAITEEAIKRIYGDNVWGAVLGIAGGFATGILADTLLESFDESTGLISDLGSVVDDVFDLF